MGKIKEDYTFLQKKKEQKSKRRYHNDICSWKRDSFSGDLFK